MIWVRVSSLSCFCWLYRASPSLATKSVKVKVTQSCPTLCNPMDYTGQNTGVGSLSLLQGIFPTLGLNPGLPHCRQILYQLSHKGSPRILEWVAYPFSRVSSQPRDRTRVSCIAGRLFTNWAMREARTKSVISLISLLAVWWCPCVESSLVLLEKGVWYDQCVLLAKLC